MAAVEKISRPEEIGSAVNKKKEQTRKKKMRSMA